MTLMSRNGEGHVTPHVREVEKGMYMHRAGQCYSTCIEQDSVTVHA